MNHVQLVVKNFLYKNDIEFVKEIIGLFMRLMMKSIQLLLLRLVIGEKSINKLKASFPWDVVFFKLKVVDGQVCWLPANFGGML